MSLHTYSLSCARGPTCVDTSVKRLGDRRGLRVPARLGASWREDQTRRTAGLVVGGAPGGLADVRVSRLAVRGDMAVRLERVATAAGCMCRKLRSPRVVATARRAAP